jgi:hypothetical protein
VKLSGQRNECPSCGLYFNSNAAFEKHREGKYTPNTRHCLSEEQMVAKGMKKRTDGFWAGSAMPDTLIESKSK